MASTSILNSVRRLTETGSSTGGAVLWLESRGHLHTPCSKPSTSVVNRPREIVERGHTQRTSPRFPTAVGGAQTRVRAGPTIGGCRPRGWDKFHATRARRRAAGKGHHPISLAQDFHSNSQVHPQIRHVYSAPFKIKCRVNTAIASYGGSASGVASGGLSLAGRRYACISARSK